MKAVKWLAIYVLLTLGFAAATALATFIYDRILLHTHRHELGTLFFFFLFPAGIVLVLMGCLSVFHAPIAWIYGDYPERKYTEAHLPETKFGILMILTGLTLILVSLTHLLVSG